MTPDLQTQIRSDALTRKRANEISEASKSLTNGFRLWSGWELGFFRRTPFLEVPDLHDYLTEAADWHADTWDFAPEGRERLARSLGWLYEWLPETLLPKVAGSRPLSPLHALAESCLQKRAGFARDRRRFFRWLPVRLLGLISGVRPPVSETV